MQLKDYNPKTDKPDDSKLLPIDKWAIQNTKKMLDSVKKHYESYNIPAAKREAEKFFWHFFCDNYLEIVKDRLYNPDTRGAEARKSGQESLFQTILAVIKMIAPVMPHITEEIYQLYFAAEEKCKSVHLSSWPEFKNELVDEEIELVGDLGVDIINAVRKYKSEKQMSLKEELNELVLVSEEDNFKEMITSIAEDLKAVLKVKEIKFSGETSLETEKFKVSVGISQS